MRYAHPRKVSASLSPALLRSPESIAAVHAPMTPAPSRDGKYACPRSHWSSAVSAKAYGTFTNKANKPAIKQLRIQILQPNREPRCLSPHLAMVYRGHV